MKDSLTIKQYYNKKDCYELHKLCVDDDLEYSDKFEELKPYANILRLLIGDITQLKYLYRAVNGTLDLSACTELTTLITTGSNVGIKLPQGTKVNSLTLGSPYTLEVDTPTVLGNNGTYSIVSSANLQSANGSLKLINVNSSSETKKGFTMFGNLFNVGGN